MKDIAKILQHVETIKKRAYAERQRTLGHVELTDWPYGDILKLCKLATRLATSVHVPAFDGGLEACLSRALYDLEHKS